VFGIVSKCGTAWFRVTLTPRSAFALLYDLIELCHKYLQGYTVPAKMATPAPPPYQVQMPENFSFRPDDWPKWKRRFERFREASGLSKQEAESQINTLIYCMGDEADDILSSLALKDDEAKVYKTVVAKFDGYFIPKRNIIFERAKFHKRSQKEGEQVDSFFTDLYKLAETCEFGTLKDDMIRDRIVVGILDGSLSEKMQLDDKLTLQKAMTMARSKETVRGQQKVIRSDSSSCDVSKVQAKKNGPAREFKPRFEKPAWVKGKQKRGSKPRPEYAQAQSSQCHRCGKSPAHSKIKCPAKAAECHKCHFVGHYEKMCRSDKVKSVGEVGESLDSDSLFLGEVNSPDSKLQWVSSVKIGDTTLNWKIDTGADVSCIPAEVYTRNKHKLGHLIKSDKKLFGAGGNELRVKGVIPAQLEKKKHTVDNLVYVVQGLRNPLLGRPAIQALKLVSVVESVEQIDQVPEDIKAQYPELFSGLGKMGSEYTIKLKEDAKPYSINTPRRIPIPLLKRTKAELKRMKGLGVITEVTEPTEWAAGMVVVPKANGSVRICVDLTQLNQSVCRERHQMPSVEYTLSQLRGAKVFTKLDANSGFWQIPLNQASSNLTCFMTPWGRFRFNRLPYGISSGPELFQRRMEEILEGLEGVVVEIDDILVYGENQHEHDLRLHAVLQRLVKAGVTLNGPKCEFSKEKLLYLAHILDGNGITADPRKVNAIQEMEEPKDVPELRRFLGMINYLGRFIPDLASKTEPLRSLMNKKNSWVWDSAQKHAFQSLKEELISPPVLAHYDPDKETIISADASSYGLGGCLLQVQSNKEKRPVAYASRALNETEQRYAQIEKEALASTWACERFSDYVLGKTFTLETDHKPLVPLLGGGKSLDQLPARVQRFKLRLMKYSFVVKHVPGKELFVADALSRAPVDRGLSASEAALCSETDAFVNAMFSDLPATDKRLREIREKQWQDEVCVELFKYVEKGWPDRPFIKNCVKPYYPVAGEIT